MPKIVSVAAFVAIAALGAAGWAYLARAADAGSGPKRELVVEPPAQRPRPQAMVVPEVERVLSEAKPERPTQQPARASAAAGPVEAAAVQGRLATLRYLPPDAVTGVWDSRTSQAVLAFQGWQGLARDGIVGPRTLAALEGASRPQPAVNGNGRRIEVHRARGVVLLVDGRDVIRVVHASTGAPGYETPAGSYSVFRKETNSWSVPYRVWLPYAAYFNGGIAFHAYEDVPAWPASHGCVRLSAPEAAFVYEFATVGTPVEVY